MSDATTRVVVAHLNAAASPDIIDVATGMTLERWKDNSRGLGGAAGMGPRFAMERDSERFAAEGHPGAGASPVCVVDPCRRRRLGVGGCEWRAPARSVPAHETASARPMLGLARGWRAPSRLQRIRSNPRLAKPRAAMQSLD